MCLSIHPGTHQSPVGQGGTLTPVSKGLSFPDGPIDSWLHLTEHSRPCPRVVMRQFAKTIKRGQRGRAPMDNKDSCHRLSGVAQSPYLKRRFSETATYSTIDCGYGSSWPRDIDW